MRHAKVIKCPLFIFIASEAYLPSMLNILLSIFRVFRVSDEGCAILF
jgi:hypothetical protein